MSEQNFAITFRPSGRGKAQCPPDPDFPDGKHIILTRYGEISCVVDLPYPAKECGAFIVCCKTCDLTIAVTAAGRPDDPTSIRVPCKFKSMETT